MKEVQLYIEGQRVDLFKDETISVTQSIQNVKDPAKIFTEFSKTFSVPASKSNNKIFKHYYNYDIVNGFDARQKVSAEIMLNYISFKLGYIKLEGVDLVDNKPHTYRITFFGSTVTLKDLIGEDKLGALTWLDNFAVEYSAANIQTGLTTGFNKIVDSVVYSSAIITPLISHTKRLYYDSSAPSAETGNLYYDGTTNEGVLWSDLKYSIRVHCIIKAIEKQYGITFSTDFFNTSNSIYHNLYMWMHRVKGNVQSSLSGDLLYSKVVLWNTFDASDGNSIIYTDPEDEGIFNVNLIYGQIATATFNFTTSSTDNYNIYLKKNGVTVAEYRNQNGNFSFSYYFNDESLNGQYSVTLESKVGISFSPNTDIDFVINTDLTTYNYTATSFNDDIDAFFLFYPTQQLPEIKVLDFLTGIFKMFNLTAYVENGIIIVTTLDSFYSSNNKYDVSEYVSTNKKSVDTALPYKQIDFRYAGNKTFLADKFLQLNNQEFGALEYKSNNDNFLGDIYKIELPFEKMIYERLTDYTDTNTTIQWGWMADNKEEAYIGSPLIHYAYKITSGTTISFRISLTTKTSLNRYHIPLNQNGISVDSRSLNFKAEIDEFNLVENANGLFVNYVSYISDIFNAQKRLTKLTAYLPLKIFTKIKLSDRFIITNRKYFINSIDTNLQTGESKLELLNDLTTD